MKTLGIWVIVMITLGCSTSYAQKSTKGDRETFRTQRLALHLTYDDNVPYFDHQTILELAKQGKLELSSRKIKGRYEDFGLYYRPCYTKEMLYLSNGRVSYKLGCLQYGERTFAWWFLSALLGIVFAILAHITKKRILLTLALVLLLVYIIYCVNIICYTYLYNGAWVSWMLGGFTAFVCLAVIIGVLCNTGPTAFKVAIVCICSWLLAIFVMLFFGGSIINNIDPAISISSTTIGFLSLIVANFAEKNKDDLDEDYKKAIFFSMLIFYLFIPLGTVLTYFQI